MFVFPDCHFYVGNGMPSQLIRLGSNCEEQKNRVEVQGNN